MLIYSIFVNYKEFKDLKHIKSNYCNADKETYESTDDNEYTKENTKENTNENTNESDNEYESVEGYTNPPFRRHRPWRRMRGNRYRRFYRPVRYNYLWYNPWSWRYHPICEKFARRICEGNSPDNYQYCYLKHYNNCAHSINNAPRKTLK